MRRSLLRLRLAELLLLILDDPADHLPPQRLDQLGRQLLLGRACLYLVDHLLDAPGHARFGGRVLQLPRAIDIGEALADEIDKFPIDPVDLAPHLLHVRAILGLPWRHGSFLHAGKSGTTASASIST